MGSTLFQFSMVRVPLKEDGLRKVTAWLEKIFGSRFSHTIRVKNSSTQNWNVTPCIEGMGCSSHGECSGPVTLGNSSSLGNVTCRQPCSSLPVPALVPLAVGILSKRTNLSTHSSCALGWSRTRGVCVCYGLWSTSFILLFAVDGRMESAPSVPCVTTQTWLLLSAKLGLIYFLGFGESKCRWQTGLILETSFSSC